MLGRNARMAGGAMSSSLREGGQLDVDQASVRAMQTVWRQSTGAVARAGVRRVARPVARLGARQAARLGTWAARRVVVATVQATVVGVKALLAAVGATSSVLPVVIGVIAVVAALCSILPSFITGVGSANNQPKNLTGHCGGTVSFEIPEEAKTWVSEAEKTSGIPAAYFAFIAQRETDFNYLLFADDYNGGTWGLFQLNHEEWSKVFPGALVTQEEWSAGSVPPPGVTDPLLHAHYGGVYFKNRLETVRKLKEQNPSAEFAKLTDLEALTVAHNAGEGTLRKYGTPAWQEHRYRIVRSYLDEMRQVYHPEPCDGPGSAAPGASGLAGVDDYESWWVSNGSHERGYDDYGFAWAQCTSYAGFAVRTYHGHKDFNNWWHGAHFGDAKLWADAARQVGIRVDQTPAVGAVAQRLSGDWGHVAFVVAVHEDGSFTINEYNHVTSRRFSSRVARVGSGSHNFDNFIHFEDTP
ncbi:MAG: CHAP domain-containing protein [Arachnia propionica]|uniref:CHAP domain-containing protein n=1 Tax=Arachnia propionica TaxID=1750 RepID=UPI0026FB33F7|nr:CHAP domain-containing protein [Arachnia propionica]